jgi:ABC-type antimicrobial peptide transport system permease subunit
MLARARPAGPATGGVSLVSTMVGAALGTAGAFYLSRALRAMLFGVEPGNPATLAIVAALFLAVAAAASYLPARRATRINPVMALRAE